MLLLVGFKMLMIWFYLKQCHYNPVLGRFYQPDPVTFIMKGHGQTNRYQYGWNDTYTFSDPTGQAAVVKNGVWVEDGMSFYSTSGGSVTDYLGQNFLNDFATLAPTPKFKWLTGISDLIFKPQYDNIMDLKVWHSILTRHCLSLGLIRISRNYQLLHFHLGLKLK